MAEPRKAQIVAIGSAQLVAWASSTYLPAVVAVPMAGELGLAVSWVFAAFSGALGLMAVLGPAVGRAIDRRGGRQVLCLGSLTLSAGLLCLAAATGPRTMFAGWLLLGVGMAGALYDAAFAALVREHGLGARGAITGITLLGGFASTVGWPLSSLLVELWNWRVACLFWALANLALALPLNFRFATAFRPVADKAAPTADSQEAPAPATASRRDFALLVIFGAATAFVTSAMAAHLPLLLLSAGVGTAVAVAAAALVGPAQVVARTGEFIVDRRWQPSPLRGARLATALHPAGGLLLLGFAGAPVAACLFAVLHGAGNGLITIARGTLPLHLFGSVGYGLRQGRLAIAQRLTQALAPFLFALVVASGGATAGLALTIALSAVALAALLALRERSGRCV